MTSKPRKRSLATAAPVAASVAAPAATVAPASPAPTATAAASSSSVVVAPAPQRTRILDAAFTLLRERGYGATNTREIAAHAQVSKREIYAEFGNKEGIFRAMIANRASRMRQPLGAISISNPAELVETLRRVGLAFIGQLSDPTVVTMFRLAISTAEESSAIVHALDTEAFTPNRKALGELMTRAVQAKLLAGEVTVLVGHFLALVTSDIQMPLLMGLAERPSPRELERHVADAIDAFVTLHGAPKLAR